jgi:hypothetical protein
MTTVTRRLWGVHLLGNLALAALFWVWLGIPDARSWQLGLTAILGLAIVFGALWLHGATFRYFADSSAALPVAFRTSLRRLPLFALWAAVLVLCIFLVQRWQPAAGIPVAVRWFVAWILVPAVLLPLGAAAMGRLREALAAYRNPRYWLWTVILMVAGIYVPYRLILWAPALKAFAAEATSFAVRWLIAYLAAVTAWLMLAYVSSGGNPRLTQSKTAALP